MFSLIILVTYISVRKKRETQLELFLKRLLIPSVNKIYYPVYYINLSTCPERRFFMEKQFNMCNITNYMRIEAVDGNNLIRGPIKCTYNDIKIYNEYPDLTNAEISCTVSHLMAIKKSFSRGDDISVIMEDDCLFTTMNYWKYELPEILSMAPKDWNIIQLFVHNHEYKYSGKYEFLSADYTPSTCCYVINRRGMEAAMKFCDLNSFSILKINHIHPKYAGVADMYIYAIAKRYYIDPNLVVSFPADKTSSIQKEADKVFRKPISDFINNHQFILFVAREGNDIGFTSAFRLSKFLGVPLYTLNKKINGFPLLDINIKTCYNDENINTWMKNEKYINTSILSNTEICFDTNFDFMHPDQIF